MNTNKNDFFVFNMIKNKFEEVYNEGYFIFEI